MEHLEALGQPGRLRDRLIADAAKEMGAEKLAKIGPIGGKETPEAVRLARKIVANVYSPYNPRGGMSDKRVLRKVRAKLAQADIRRAIGDVYEMRGFSEVDAVDLHIGHIRGLGDEPPNYQALKDYQKMIFPHEAHRVQIDKRSVNVHVQSEEPMRVGPPPMRTRQLPATSKPEVVKKEKVAKHSEEGIPVTYGEAAYEAYEVE